MEKQLNFITQYLCETSPGFKWRLSWVVVICTVMDRLDLLCSRPEHKVDVFC